MSPVVLWCLVGLCSILLSPVRGATPRQHGAYTNSFAVQLSGPDGDGEAEGLAEKYGFENRGQVGRLSSMYHFVLPESNYPTSKSIGEVLYDITDSLQLEEKVKFVQQQVLKKRVRKSYSIPTDPLWDVQWPWLNTGDPDVVISEADAGRDLNVEPVWIQGVTGCNSIVAVVDDGVYYKHADLEQNYAQSLQYDYIGGDDDPLPGLLDSHGTSVAGEIAMEKDNGVCGVGVAYQSTITGLRLIDSSEIATDLEEAQALSHRDDIIEISSNSWGPFDDGVTAEGPGTLAQMAFAESAATGRSNRGTIWVWAAGNGGRYDSCAADGYVNSIYTIAIGSANSTGEFAYYDEACSAKMAVTFVTNSLSGPSVATTTIIGECVTDFDGTSAATPLASGVFALVLEANPDLTWRDIQYLIVYTSKRNRLSGTGWERNSAGRWFHPNFAFGALDAEALVSRARNWINVPEQVSQDYSPSPASGFAAATSSFITSFTVGQSIRSLEHVVVTVTTSYTTSRGNTQITLTSPNGTTSTLLFYRPADNFLYSDNIESAYTDWPFMSVHFWGENPEGDWTLTVTRLIDTMLVGDITMTLYGTGQVPEAVSRIPVQCDPACALAVDGCAAAGAEFCDACQNFRNASTLECMDDCPAQFAVRSGYCYDPSLPEPVCDRIIPTGPPTGTPSGTPSGAVETTSIMSVLLVCFVLATLFFGM